MRACVLRRGMTTTAALAALVFALELCWFDPAAQAATATDSCPAGTASGNYSTACGVGSNADGTNDNSNASAFGVLSKAYGTSSTAVGDSSEADGTWRTALGVASKAEGGYSIASGRYADAVGVNSIAIVGGTSSPFGAKAYNSGDIAIGTSSVAGSSSDSTVTYNTALGDGAQATGGYSYAVGYNLRLILAWLRQLLRRILIAFRDVRSPRSTFMPAFKRAAQRAGVQVDVEHFERAFGGLAQQRSPQPNSSVSTASARSYAAIGSTMTIPNASRRLPRSRERERWNLFKSAKTHLAEYEADTKAHIRRLRDLKVSGRLDSIKEDTQFLACCDVDNVTHRLQSCLRVFVMWHRAANTDGVERKRRSCSTLLALLEYGRLPVERPYVRLPLSACFN